MKIADHLGKDHFSEVTRLKPIATNGGENGKGGMKYSK